MYKTHTYMFLWFMGTLHRGKDLYTVKTVCVIVLHVNRMVPRYQRIGINLMLYPAFWWFVGRPKAVDRGSLLEMDNIGYIL